MKRKFSLACAAFACTLFFCSCHKDKDSIQAIPPDENTTTSVGTPVGLATVKTIDALGGEIASEDGTIKIIIPSGALSAAKEIRIQPVTNQLPSGIGNAYRITPHGEQFSKPVTLVFKFKPEDLSSAPAEFLDIAYQDSLGTWQAITKATLDKVNQEIRITTTHFSDWTYFKSLKLEPAAATVETGAVIELKLTTTFPYVDPDDAPEARSTIPVYTSPRALRPDEIKGWSYSGEGSLDPDGSTAIYAAPDHVPSANPEAVAVTINMHRKGQFMLIANITILGDEQVTYLRVDEDYLSPVNKGKCAMYLYGSFGIDAGAGKRSVKIDGIDAEIDLWSPGIIRCLIDRQVSGAIEISSNGKVIARSVLRKFKGSFLYTRYHGGALNSGSPDALKETTRFDLVYRGFGAPCPADLDPLFVFDESLAEGTEANFTLSGSASVTTPVINGCSSTTSVSLQSSSGIQPINPLSVSGFSRFHCYVKDVEGGIELKIDYNINNVLDGVIVKRANCGSTSYDPARSLGVGFDGFNLKAINLRFWGTDELALKDSDKIKSVRMSSGILIEAWDNTVGSPTQYDSDGLMEATFENAY